ncbi:MAG: MFS transporter [Anaerolineae bacterium]|jgi:MFS family permease|nr:MFS transporter [Anaerolineae bacterium]MCZ7552971.1 MFS transporter [Anaerolineales bacterium]
MENIFSQRLRARLLSPLEILQIKDFRLLWMGEFFSLIGDQFYWIALPWLILKLTGNPLVLGSLMAIQMVPRSIFMLIGGALTDRFSPRKVVFVSVIMRCVLVGTLAGLVLTGMFHLWILYLLALCFGIVDGFFFPAQNSIIPALLDEKKLQTGNALIQGTAQLSMFLGPLVAGLLIAWLNGPNRVIISGRTVEDLQGIGIAFGIDALGYFLAAIFISRIQKDANHIGLEEGSKQEGVLRSIQTGLAYAWKNEDLRIFFLLVALMAFVVNGTLIVGVPVLVNIRFVGGAAAYGLIMSAFGGGSLIGILLASSLPQPPSKLVGQILLLIVGALGFGLIVLAFTTNAFIAALISLITGIGGGYVLIMVITWLQLRAPPTMLGRTMSLLTFATIGLNPIAVTLAGALSKWNVTGLLIGSGGLLVLIAFGSAFSGAGKFMET